MFHLCSSSISPQVCKANESQKPPVYGTSNIAAAVRSKTDNAGQRHAIPAGWPRSNVISNLLALAVPTND